MQCPCELLLTTMRQVDSSTVRHLFSILVWSRAKCLHIRATSLGVTSSTPGHMQQAAHLEQALTRCPHIFCCVCRMRHNEAFRCDSRLDVWRANHYAQRSDLRDTEHTAGERGNLHTWEMQRCAIGAMSQGSVSCARSLRATHLQETQEEASRSCTGKRARLPKGTCCGIHLDIFCLALLARARKLVAGAF